MLEKALLYAQSGGPTSVINASACGVIRQAQKEGLKVYVALNGVDGIFKGNIVDVSAEDDKEIDKLCGTPASAFGSCRIKLPDYRKDDTMYFQLLETFKKLNVRYFVYNGGNDSMNTCAKVAEFMKNNDYECYVMGVPKTIDNDLLLTDHCPGYGSAAKYIATTCYEIGLDTAVYSSGRVTVVEIMGRDAGWLTASSALAGLNGYAPDLIYLPERAFDIEDFCKRCEEVYSRKKSCLVAVSEGIRDKDGEYICNYAKQGEKDAFNNTQLGGVGSFLADYVTKKTGIKSRSIELSLMQRCAAHICSKTDVEEAFEAGRYAVKSAVAGETGKMIAFKRKSNAPYEIEYVAMPLDDIAKFTQSMPDEYIGEDGCSVTQAFIDYAKPLIQGEMPVEYVNGLPVYAKLKNQPIKF